AHALQVAAPDLDGGLALPQLLPQLVGSGPRAVWRHGLDPGPNATPPAARSASGTGQLVSRTQRRQEMPMLKRLCRTLAGALAGALAVASLAAGCGSKEVTVSTDEAQQRIEQLSPEEQDAIRRSQEAAAATA